MVLAAKKSEYYRRHEKLFTLTRTVSVCAFFIVFGCEVLMAAWPWEENVLVTINGERFIAEDFRHWRNSRQEDGAMFPDSLEPFIEWHLLAREARNMKLYQEPNYKDKMQRFLEARSLMMLKAETMDPKIDINEELLRRRYANTYCPRWLVELLYFDEEQNAIQAYVKLNSSALTTDELIGKAAMEGGAQKHEKKWLRYGFVSENWQERLNGMSVGGVALPMLMGKGFVVLKLNETKGPDDTDFKKLRNRIQEEVKEELEGELFAELLSDLRIKYEVKVDQDLLAAMQRDDIPEEVLEKTLISTNREQIPARVLVDQLAKDQQIPSRFADENASFEELKQRAFDNLLSQKLLVWEALDRHYEEKSLFKRVFQLYSERRLIKELEKRLFLPESRVSNEEVFQYYQEHMDQYGQPEIVSIAVFEDNKRIVDAMWEEVLKGRNFFEVARKDYAKTIRIHDMPVTRLDPAMRSMVQRLAEGEISSPVTVKDGAFMVMLVNRKAAIPTPFYKVRSQIAQELQRTNFNQLKADFLRLLKSRSSISVDKREWEAIKAEAVN